MIRKSMSGRRGGFTLVELLLVLVILATLAAIVIPRVAGRGEDAKKTAAQTDCANLGRALDYFEADNQYYPSTTDGLDVLVNQPRDAKSWKGPYVKEIPRDPWDNDYVYEYPGKNNANGFDLYSVGADHKVGGGDDVNEKGMMQ